MNFSDLEKILKVSYKDIKLLSRALTHRSYLNEHTEENLVSNERMEFLGDAILELLISRKIYEDYPDMPEGDMTALRSRIVCTKTLSEISTALRLGEYLLLSRGEDEGGGRKNQTLLANCLEAVMGSIFLDQGFEKTDEFVRNNFYPKISEILNQNLKDSKSLFQEQAQEVEKITPNYKVLKEVGPDHDKIFTVGVYVGMRKIAQAEGKSKQEAEENSAKLALEKYQQKQYN